MFSSDLLKEVNFAFDAIIHEKERSKEIEEIESEEFLSKDVQPSVDQRHLLQSRSRNFNIEEELLDKENEFLRISEDYHYKYYFDSWFDKNIMSVLKSIGVHTVK